jgi:tRNA dimethylallyltransferase
MTNPKGTKPVALIAGPTASGKTALALSLARNRDITIINADSAQVYANLPILSAQPTPAELETAPHRLFGYLGGAETCSAARWAADAKVAIADAHDADRLPVLVGGTGLYLRALLDGIAPIPEIDPEVRRSVRELTTADAQMALALDDAVMANKLDANDDSRIKRALEVVRSTGRSIADWREAKEGGIADEVTLHPLILLPPREWLHARCDARFVAMLEMGAVDEVEALLALDLPPDAPVMRAIGVTEVRAMLSGETDQQRAILLGQAATRQYAKRQYTWFRNQSPVDWPRWGNELNNDNLKEIERLLLF